MITSKLKDIEDAYQVKTTIFRGKLEKFGGRKGVVELVCKALEFQKNRNYQKELDLLQPLVDFLEDIPFKSADPLSYVCISDEMEWSVYRHNHPTSLERIVKNLSEICPIDSVLRQYGMAAWELGDYPTASKVLKNAINWNPMSASCKLLLSMIYMNQENWEEAFQIILEALAIAYKPTDIKLCYEFVVDYFGQKKMFEECFYFCWLQSKFTCLDHDYEKIVDDLLLLSNILKKSQISLSEEKLLNAVRKHKIPLDVNPDIPVIAFKRCQEESLANNKGLAEYFSNIILDLQRCKIKGKDKSLKNVLGRYKN
jgi:tetratricopeptide (TPR) repeat protein